jgi:hypothetical protein
MKTSVRTTVRKSQTENYNRMSIEILSPRFFGYLEPIGVITFQQTVGEDSWYGMRFEISTSDAKHIQQMAKLANFIKKKVWDATPDKVLELIGADEHVVYESDFVSLSKNGQNLYRVIAQGGHYKDIIAPDDKTADKILKKLNISNSTLEFVKVVEL